MGIDHDSGARIQEQVRAAGTALDIVGGGTKSFLGRSPRGERLALADHTGILNYQPTELVLTARSGTTLDQIEETLASSDQILPFEPPRFGPGATLGGTIAAGLSGPARPYVGAARDFVLGIRMINGHGHLLRFGGEVMKNVAGYDVSRLMVGAMGTLGVLLDISIKVLPRPACTLTLMQERDLDDAIRIFNEWAARPLPLTAACWYGGRLFVRLSGASSAVRAGRERVGGDRSGDGDSFWANQVREQGHPFFGGSLPLWRLSVPPATPPMDLPGDWFIDWGGAQRWLRTEAAPEIIHAAAARVGGHASLFRGGDREGMVAQPLTAGIAALHHSLKQAFDPKRLFNPGRLYPDL